MRAAAHERVALFAGPTWTVVAEEDARPRPAPLHRFVRALPCETPDGVAGRSALRPAPRGRRRRRLRCSAPALAAALAAPAPRASARSARCRRRRSPGVTTARASSRRSRASPRSKARARLPTPSCVAHRRSVGPCRERRRRIGRSKASSRRRPAGVQYARNSARAARAWASRDSAGSRSGAAMIAAGSQKNTCVRSCCRSCGSARVVRRRPASRASISARRCSSTRASRARCNCWWSDRSDGSAVRRPSAVPHQPLILQIAKHDGANDLIDSGEIERPDGRGHERVVRGMSSPRSRPRPAPPWSGNGRRRCRGSDRAPARFRGYGTAATPRSLKARRAWSRIRRRVPRGFRFSTLT